MFKRQREGSVLCTSCGVLVGVNDPTCYNCGRRNPGLWGFAPALRTLGNDLGFVPVVIGGCVIMYVLSLVMSRDGNSIGLNPTTGALVILGASGAVPVFTYGWWWTVLTAGWLHGGVLHIFLNVLGITRLGPEVANLDGPGRMVLIYTFSSVCGFTLSSVLGLLPLQPLFGAPVTVGASAAIMGFVGALAHYARRSGSRHIGQWATQYAIAMAVMGLIGFGGIRVDNAAHLGGFIGGYLASRVLDPLKPERIDHIAIAVGCLALSILSVVASVLLGLQFL